MKVLLVSPVTPISPRPTSHRGAQAEIYADQLQRATGVPVTMAYSGHDLDPGEFTDVYVYHGNDWGGSLNLFGGLDDEAARKAITFYSRLRPEHIYSLGIQHPNYHSLFHERIVKAKTPEQAKPWGMVDWDNLKEMQRQADISGELSFSLSNKVVIGDSHAISLYRPGWDMNSVPFKTLHGALSQEGGLNNFWPLLRRNIEAIDFYFGNIDVRHHLVRHGKKSAVELATEYARQAKEIAVRTGADVSLYEPLPIEDESRVVPKTGWYKGTPFYGDWQERNDIRKVFTDTLEELSDENVSLMKWTDYLLNDRGQLDFKHMEKPRSIHLARSSYPYWTGRETKDLVLEAFT